MACCIVAAMVAFGLLLQGHAARASGQSDAAKLAFDRELQKAASQLDAAAARAKTTPHGAHVPILHLPPAPLGGTPMYSPSLDQWLQSTLAQVRDEKAKKTQARDLGEIAASLRRAAESGGAITAPATNPERETLRILAQGSYQSGAGPAPAPKETLWQRILRWLSQRLRDLLERIFGAAASKPIVGQVIAVLLVVLLAGFAAYLIYALAMSFSSKRKRQVLDEGAPLQERADPESLYHRCLAAAGAGQYAQAIALLFQASLAGFDRAGKLEFDASRTAGEYRRAVRGTLFAASPYFDTIAHQFVLAAFSQRPVSENDWSAADAAYHSLQPLLIS